MRGFLVAGLTMAILGSASLRADFSYQEATKIAGVSGKPVTITRAIKANRMLDSSKDHATIVDLDKATLTQIDRAKKTYSVEALAQSPATSGAIVKFSVNTTGQTKQIGVVIGRQMILTTPGPPMIFAELWVATIPGYDEARTFMRKLGEKLGYSFLANLPQTASIPVEAQGRLAELIRAMVQIDGAPLQRSVLVSGEGPPLAIETQLSEFSSAPVDAARFEIPVGFKQVAAH